MEYKLLAVDLDGTLVRRDGTIDEADRAAIARLRSAGVPVTIVTGRLYSGSRDVALHAGIHGPIACVDGSHIVDTRDDAALYRHALRGPQANSLRSILARHGPASFLFARDSIVYDIHGHPFAPYVRGWSHEMIVTESVISHPHWDDEHGVMAVVSVGSELQIRAATEELKAELASAAFVVSFAIQRGGPGTHAMIVRAAGATKGTAITWLSSHYDCSPSEVVAVGDWINDVSMFDVCGRSFVMAQAPDVVKAAATDQLVADADSGGGVAEAIERVWGPFMSCARSIEP